MPDTKQAAEVSTVTIISTNDSRDWEFPLTLIELITARLMAD